jgi:biotin carboxylase
VKSILILGAGIMQVPGIRIAKRKGWRVIVADGNPVALARDMADQFEAVDLKDKEALLAVARGCAARGGLDGVFTAGTDFSSSVAWVAERMKLPGIPFETAMRATDKCLMRQAFEKAGVPGPRFACWTGQSDPRTLLGRGLDFPLVVKPVDNMGARGVVRVDDEAALSEACEKAHALSRSARVIVEQYMEGPEFSLDAVVDRGRVTVCGVADRHICFPPSFVEMGHTIPTDADRPTVLGLEKTFVAGIRALGIDCGAAKGDIKLTPGGPMVGEIAARLSGGYMSGWTFPLSSGVEVTEAALDIAVGLHPADLRPRFERVCAERAIISIPGAVEEVAGSNAARMVPGVEEVFLRVGPGDEVVFPANNVQKCGNIIAVGEDRFEAFGAAASGLACTWIKLKPLTEKTSRYLFSETGNDAFAQIDDDLKRRLGALPPFRGDLSRFSPDGRIPVEELPGLEESRVKDWYSMTLGDAASAALRRGGGDLQPLDRGGKFVLSGLFWRALIRASTQGGAYLLQSVREAARRGSLRDFLTAT